MRPFQMKITGQTCSWTLPWRTRLYVAICVLLGWPFKLEGEFTISGIGDVDLQVLP